MMLLAKQLAQLIAAPPTADCRLPTADCRLPTAKRGRLATADVRALVAPANAAIPLRQRSMART